VLLIGSLFILLSARLELDALQYIDTHTLLFLGVLVLVVRPLAVFISSIGTRLTWEEQTFLAWMAPRGIVAAAVASLFAFELADVFPQEVEGIVPVVFSVILGTVAIYGLSATPLARWLGLADPNPQGILFIGAADWVRRIARTIQDVGFSVRMIDANPSHVRRAREEDLPADRMNALSESALDEIDLSGIGRLLIMIPNDEVSSLTALHFSDVFDTANIYQLSAHIERQSEKDVLPRHLRGHPLFGDHTTYEELRNRFERGDEIKIYKLSEEFTYGDLRTYYEGAVIPLFVLRDGELVVVSEEGQFTPRPDDKLIALVNTDETADMPLKPEDEELDMDHFEVDAETVEPEKA